MPKTKLTAINKQITKNNSRKENPLIAIHAKAFINAYNQAVETPVSTLISCTIIAITLLLATSLFVTMRSFQGITQYLKTTNQATIYLRSEYNESQILHWIEELKHDPLIKEVTYISKEQALEDLKANADLGEILKDTAENPLPPVILLKLNSEDSEQITRLTKRLNTSPLVASVDVDFNWLKRLATLFKLVQRVSYALSLFFGLGILFIISHAIQGATQRNQQEIYLLQLIGASNAYIRRPFLYFGALLGIGSGLLTLIFLFLVFLALSQPLTEFLQSYNLSPVGILFDLHICTYLLLVSTLLGFLGAWFAFYRYAKIT